MKSASYAVDTSDFETQLESRLLTEQDFVDICKAQSGRNGAFEKLALRHVKLAREHRLLLSSHEVWSKRLDAKSVAISEIKEKYTRLIQSMEHHLQLVEEHRKAATEKFPLGLVDVEKKLKLARKIAALKTKVIAGKTEREMMRHDLIDQGLQLEDANRSREETEKGIWLSVRLSLLKQATLKELNETADQQNRKSDALADEKDRLGIEFQNLRANNENHTSAIKKRPNNHPLYPRN